MVTRVSRRRKRVSKRRKQSGGKRKVSRRRRRSSKKKYRRRSRRRRQRGGDKIEKCKQLLKKKGFTVLKPDSDMIVSIRRDRQGARSQKQPKVLTRGQQEAIERSLAFEAPPHAARGEPVRWQPPKSYSSTSSSRSSRPAFSVEASGSMI